MIDPVTGWAITKAAGELSKKLYEFGKSLKDRELKQQIDEILDGLRDLKQTASLLEDENRELREKLRFKGDDFEFQGYYWVEKQHENRPLCPICFDKQKVAYLGEKYQSGDAPYRACTVCRQPVQVGPSARRAASHFDEY